MKYTMCIDTRRAIKSGLYRFLLAALVAPVLLAGAPAHKLVVISVDGFDSRFLTDSSLHVKIPNIRKLVREGASSTVVAVAPSATGPTNVSLLTGVPPDFSTVMA